MIYAQYGNDDKWRGPVNSQVFFIEGGPSIISYSVTNDIVSATGPQLSITFNPDTISPSVDVDANAVITSYNYNNPNIPSTITTVNGTCSSVSSTNAVSQCTFPFTSSQLYGNTNYTWNVIATNSSDKKKLTKGTNNFIQPTSDPGQITDINENKN